MAAEELEFLDAQSDVYLANKAGVEREERRLFGGDAVIQNKEEFPQWTGEQDTHYKIRVNQAEFLPLPDSHAATLAGHIARVAPMPNFGTLGDVREREEIARGQETEAELFAYNVNGTGRSGTQWHAYMNGMQKRAIATGHRYCLVEMPSGPTGRDVLTRQDMLDGHRAYLVEFSPNRVPYAEDSFGRFDWLVARTWVRPKGVTGWVKPTDELGYYLFVRSGYTGLGGQFESGGWWRFDHSKEPVSQGDWTRTNGEIPIAMLIGESSQGTDKTPAISRSLTMPLGQIAVSLMNRISERDFDASDAAKSVKYVLGADKDGFNLAVEFHKENALLIPIIGVQRADGTTSVPQIYDGSSGAVAAEVFTTIIESKLATAREIMVRQLTSTEDASGVAKEAGFAEATSPLLAMLAANREACENAIIQFVEMRNGHANPSGFVQYPREFPLVLAMTKIERNIKRMQEMAVRSPLLEARLIADAAKADGVFPTDEAEGKAAFEELLSSARAASTKVKAEAMALMVNAGADLESASREAGFSEEAVTALVSGGSNNSGEDQDRSNGNQGNGNGVPPTSLLETVEAL